LILLDQLDLDPHSAVVQTVLVEVGRLQVVGQRQDLVVDLVGLVAMGCLVDQRDFD
jgi:hypothetical protein